ncbi:MAG: hypothetical protein AAGF12_21790 [Myxococcota bacterium]
MIWKRALVLLFGLTVACSDDVATLDGSTPDTSVPDGAVDAGPDASDDARVDATMDAATDTGTDGPGDAAVDGDATGDRGNPLPPMITGVSRSNAAVGAPLEVTGANLSGAMVEIGGVMQTIAGNSDVAITIPEVAATTPLGAQPVVATTAGGMSPAFGITVVSPLSVESASATGPTEVEVEFSRALDSASVNSGDFTIAGLTVSAASTTGTTVTLTTDVQSGGMAYTVSVSGLTDSFGNPLTGTTSANFTGFTSLPPTVSSVTTEVVAGFSELTVMGTNLEGASVTVGGTAQTILTNTATRIVIATVAGATPTGTQTVTVTTPGGMASANTDVLGRFRMDSAVADGPSSVVITFNRDVGAVAPARFMIGGLTVSAASASGSEVTLTTSAQTPGASYSVTADAMLLDTLGTPVTSDAAAFTGYMRPVPTEVVVVRVGDGATALSSAAAAVFLERRVVATGVVAGTLTMPTATSGSNLPFTLAGSASADGSLSLSDDGRLLAIQGFQSVPGTAAVQSVSDPRVVAVIDAGDFGGTPNIDTSTTLGTLFSTTAPRGAAIDGSTIWVVGGFGGVWTVPLGGSAPTRVTATTEPSSGRAIAVYGGQLFYASGGGSPAQLNQIGMGLPTASGTTTTVVYSTSSPYSFAAFDLDGTVAGLDTIYQCNDSAGGGILRFEKDSAGTWTQAATFGPPVRQAACFEDGSDVVCIGSSPSNLYRLTDTNASSSSGSMTSIATAATNTAFRGVAVMPRP